MRLKTLILISILSLLLAGFSFSQESSSLVTYGPSASTREGDDDFRQIIYFRIPAGYTDSLYLRIFDADCGGEYDSRYGEWDAEFSYRLYGGDGVFTNPVRKTPAAIYDAAHDDLMLSELSFGIDNFADGQWSNFPAFVPSAGEKYENYYYLKLVIEGSSGNDGNIYDVFVSSHPKRNIRPEGLEIFDYTPTIRLPEADIFAEMRFLVPEKTDLIYVHNFDIAGGIMGLETSFRSNIPVQSSEQDSWAETVIELKERETGKLCAVTFAGGAEIPNDATFFVNDDFGNALPIQLPIYIRSINNRPLPQVEYYALSDAKTIVFDGSKSTDADGDVLEYFWDFGDSSFAQGERVMHKYASGGAFTATLIVADNSGQVGNSSERVFTVLVNQSPVAKAGPDLIGAPGEALQFDGSQSFDPDGVLTRYMWDFGDGKRAEGVSLTHTYKRAGHYTAKLRVEDNSRTPQNFSVDTVEVWVNSPPVVDAGKDVACSIDEGVSLTGKKSYDSDGEISEYIWDLGDGNVVKGKDIIHSYNQPGTYTVKLSIADDAGAVNSAAADKLLVVVNDPPIPLIAIDDARVASKEKITFSGKDSYDRDGKIVDYYWEFGDGESDRGAAVRHAYDSPGRYTVTLTVRDNSGTSSEYRKEIGEVIINFPPSASAGEDQMVTTSDVRFDGRNSGDQDGYITRYLWEFGDGFTSDQPAPVHIYANPGKYKVKLTVTDDSETSSEKDSDNLVVIINNLPIADAGTDHIAAPKQEIEFDGGNSFDKDGKISAYRWDFGDGTKGKGEKVSHKYAKPGIYTVTLTVEDNTGHKNAFSSDEAIVTVNAPPVADAGLDVIAAPKDKVTLNAGNSYDTDGRIVSYDWEFSDGFKPLQSAKVIRVFDNPGVYTASLTVKDNSGASNDRRQDKVVIRINNAPTAQAGIDVFTNKPDIEFDGSKSVDPDGDKLSYAWDFGDGSPVKYGVKVKHQYRKGGNYPVILTVDDGLGLKNSTNSTSKTVSINEPPKADAGKDTTICAGDVVLFNGLGSSDPEKGVLKYRWDFGDGSTGEGANPAKTYTKGGVYQVKLWVTDDSGLPGNEDVDQIAVRVAVSPVADAGQDKVVGVNQSVQFDGSGSTDVDGLVNNFVWDFGDGTTGGGATPIHFYTAPGIYRVVLTITGDKIGNCSNKDTDEMLVTVHDAPVAQFTVVPAAPVDTPVAFDGSGSTSRMAPIVEYKWDFGDGISGEGVSAEHTYNAAGKYIVTLTVVSESKTEFNSGSVQKLVIINDAPIANAGNILLVGVGQLAILDASESVDPDGAVTKYQWDFGDGTTGTGVQSRHIYAKSGKYTVILRTYDDTKLDNNWSVDTTFVEVNTQPTAVIACPVWVCPNDEVLFKGGGSFDTDGGLVGYNWNFSDGAFYEGRDVRHRFLNPGKYQVTLTVDDGLDVTNSLDDTTITINVNFPPVANAGLDRIASPGEVVKFDASQSFDKDGKITSYEWNFGDGSYNQGLKVDHTYADAGTYEAVLTVVDDSGADCGSVDAVVKVRVNAPPIADAGDDKTGYCGGAIDDIVFDASASYDPDGDPLTYKWDFGDGTSAFGSQAAHKYLNPGVYKVVLTVNDNTGAKNAVSTDTIDVAVQKH